MSLGEVHFIIVPINDNKSIIIEANLELNLYKKYIFDSENIKKVTMGRKKIVILYLIIYLIQEYNVLLILMKMIIIGILMMEMR